MSPTTAAICSPRDPDGLPRIFKIVCTRGFYAISFAAAAEADSSVRPAAAAGAPEAMDVDAVRAVEEPKSVDAAPDEVPIAAAAKIASRGAAIDAVHDTRLG